MKACLILLVLAFECVSQLKCYKLFGEDLIPARLHMRSSMQQQQQQQLPIDDILYQANRQDSLYDEPEEPISYHKALQALAEAAAMKSRNEDLLSSYDLVSNSEELLDSYENKNDDVEIKADPRDEESESHSSLVAGHQYVSGGAGEGKQHLKPNGDVPNKEEVKSDEDLPAYCDPPNPCPVGYAGEDCDPRAYDEYTAEYSKTYQEQQNCMCDDDHNECKQTRSKTNDKLTDFMNNLKNSNIEDKFSPVVAKKSPRIRRDLGLNEKNKIRKLKNPYLVGEKLSIHVAKKSAPF